MSARAKRPVVSTSDGESWASWSLFIAALCLWVWGINIYRRTLVAPGELAAAPLLGLAVTLVVLVAYRNRGGGRPHVAITAVCMGCSVPYFLVLYLNKTAGAHDLAWRTVPIRRAGHMASGRTGCGEPYVVVDFLGLEKKLVFPCDFEGDIHDYRAVRVVYYTGWLGFPVVRDQTLLR